MVAAATRPDETARIWSVLESVADPEIPVLSVVDLGIVREVTPERVRITPTYTGCPATQVIQRDIRDALDAAGSRRCHRQGGSPIRRSVPGDKRLP